MREAESADQRIRYRREGWVGTVTIDGPDDEHLLTRPALEFLPVLIERIRDDREVRAVLVTGAGERFFSTGLLNPELRGAMAKEEVLDLVRTANRAFDAVQSLPQVVVAAINGEIRAGAVELALACDIRVAAAHATLMLPEARWGGFPGAGAPVRLPGVVGYGRALELVCTGRRIDAGEMERIGLVERVIASERLAAEARALAETIAASGPLATRGAKRIMRARGEPGFAAARLLSDRLRHALEWSADVDEGIAAHRENRPPRFTGS